jgi:hypothetical protein
VILRIDDHGDGSPTVDDTTPMDTDDLEARRREAARRNRSQL